MKPPPFTYVDPTGLSEATALLAAHGDEAKLLAGGQSLVPLLNMRLAQPAVLIDLNRVAELNYLREESRDGRPGIAIGAMTRHRSIERDSAVTDRLPLLREAIGWVGHPQIRNRGTVGGSIAHADPAAELPLVLVALDGVATVRSERGTRTVPAAEFFLYTFTPALEADEVLAEVWLPLPSPGTGQAFVEVARRHGDFALVSTAVSLTVTAQGRCADARIAVGGAAPVPMRARAAEAGLAGEDPDDTRLREAARVAAGEMEPTSDVHADARYRRDVAETLVYRALAAAGRRARSDA